MLIEFSVTNYRSLRDRQTLSLTMETGSELMHSNSFETVALRPLKLLKSAAIYGPNAGGKSNLIYALLTMQRIVMESSSKFQPDSELPVTPFLLDQTNSESPSEFEIIFVTNAVRYQYGFAASFDRIHDEWLFAYPKGRAQCWFERTWDKANERYDWVLGNNLSGEKQLWQKSTRDNSLFLSTAVQLNSKQLQPVYSWFKNTLHMAGAGGWSPRFSASLCKDTDEKYKENKKTEVLDFLKKADLSIENILVETRPFDSKTQPNGFPRPRWIMVKDGSDDKQVLEIKTTHSSAEGEQIEFSFHEESHGTQKMFSFAGPWIDSLMNGHVLFIDELHDNLHPSLVRYLVQLFHNDKTNPKNAQLVFTTHETSILSQEIFRRDQIWFCEKGDNQESYLYPLTDFSPRKDRENLELAYLSGRYGALPFLQSSVL